jgi:zinc protease
VRNQEKWGTKAIGVFLSLSLFFAVSTVQAGARDQVAETTLANGLKVLLLENPKAPVVTFQVWYRVGSRNEAWGKTGLSHMLEHMMFKGTAKTGAEDFSRIIQENGGNDNAFTSHDYTAYFENLSADRIQVALDLESDRMRNLVLREEDFRTERMVVMEERRMRTDDNPEAFLMEQVSATAFQIQPYHWPIIGWMEDVAGLTLEDLKAYYRTYYSPSNAFLVVVGDFRKEELLSRIEAAFGPVAAGTPPGQERAREMDQAGERRVTVKREATLSNVVMAYHVPNLTGPDSYVLELVASLLSGGKSSRLHQSLVREKRLALGVDADHSLVSRDPSLFLLSAQPLPGIDPGQVEKALDREIERLQKEAVEERELQKAKNQLEAGFILSQDSLFYQAMLLAQHEIAGSWKALDDYLPSIRKVAADDVRRVTQKYLVPENRTVGILIPLPPREGKPLPEGGGAREKILR